MMVTGVETMLGGGDVWTGEVISSWVVKRLRTLAS